MIVFVLIVFIILYLYFKYPHIFDLKRKYITGRYIRLERESGSDPINYANFIINDEDGKVINPIELSVNPGISFGDGKNPKSTIGDIEDIVLIETTSLSTSVPYVEYDLGLMRNISNIIIINRKKYKERMGKTIIRILDDNRNQIFEKKIIDIQDIYYINIS